MKKFRFILTLTVSFALLTSCINSGVVLPSATGTRYEVLVVLDEAAWKAPAGRSIVALLDQDMEALPQPEPVMSIIYCQPQQFGDLLKPTRNILKIDVNPRYDAPKILYSRNVWSQPQSVVRVNVGNDSILEKVISKYGKNILEFFLSTERERLIALSKGSINAKAQNEIKEMFGISIDVPKELNKATKGKDFYWITNDQNVARKDLVIYSYPYRDKNTFTLDYLIAKRDSVMKANIQGELEGSYMGTELVHYKPIYNAININETYCAEVKGLWRMFNGASMGGPFFSHTRVDEVNHKVITVEGYVFAPGTKKRNHIRQLESVIYTVQLPQEINALQEVSVTANKNK
ncbi:DUF4837 family protein [Paludibacter sp.]